MKNLFENIRDRIEGRAIILASTTRQTAANIKVNVDAKATLAKRKVGI